MKISSVMESINKSAILDKALKADIAEVDDLVFIDYNFDKELYNSVIKDFQNSGKGEYEDIELREVWVEDLYDTPVLQIVFADEDNDYESCIYNISIRELVEGVILDDDSVKISYEDADKSEELLLTFYVKL